MPQSTILPVTLCRPQSEQGLLVIDDFLSSKELRSARGEADRLLVGGKLQQSVQQSFGRTDQYTFVTKERGAELGCPVLGSLVERIRNVAKELDGKTCYTPQGTGDAVPFRIPEQCMLATYNGGGTRYRAHRDNACESGEQLRGKSNLEKNARYLTMILYLNIRWQEEWGGQLRCHFSSDCMDKVGCRDDCRGTECHLDVQPLGGRLCIFFSRDLLHEVLPSWQRRWALSLWVEDARVPPENREETLKDFAEMLAQSAKASGKSVEDLIKLLHRAKPPG